MVVFAGSFVHSECWRGATLDSWCVCIQSVGEELLSIVSSVWVQRDPRQLKSLQWCFLGVGKRMERSDD